MAEKRFQIFVSSTFNDLKAERERVLRTLAESNYIAAGMEFFPALDEEQFKFIKTVIDDSDYYVAIVAGKYGTIDETELCYRLINSLATTTKKYPGQGWVRGGKEAPEELLRKIVMLEEENRKLQSTIIEQQQVPLAARVAELLKGEFDVKYNYLIDNDGNVCEGALALTGIKIAQFVIPRLRKQIRDEEFVSLICELVSSITGNNVVSINHDSMRVIRLTLIDFGLISATHNAYDKIGFVVRTALGRGVVGGDVLDEFERSKRIARNVTTAQVFEDIGTLISKVVTNLIAYVEKWIGKRNG